MPAGQPLEVLVGRRGATYGVPANYDGDTPGRELTADERLQVIRASALVADAIAGGSVRESELNAAVELLLVRQFRHGSRDFSLEIPGGLVHPGENPQLAAVRELREETGFEGRVERLLWVGSGERPEVDIAYVVTIVGGTFRPCDEVDGHRMLAPGDPLPEGMLPYHAEVIALAQASLAR